MNCDGLQDVEKGKCTHRFSAHNLALSGWSPGFTLNVLASFGQFITAPGLALLKLCLFVFYKVELLCSSFEITKEMLSVFLLAPWCTINRSCQGM